MPANASALPCRAFRRCLTVGSSRWVISSTAAMCMAVGKVSLEDCDMLTSSLGCTGTLDPISPPASSMARLEITSLAFMLLWVPLPVCQTLRGKWSSNLPSDTSRAAAMISEEISGDILPRSALTWAEASFSTPMARMSGSGIRSSPIGKWCRERAVWAPQYRSAGTSMAPMLSVSDRVSWLMVHSLSGSGSRIRASRSRRRGGRHRRVVGRPAARRAGAHQVELVADHLVALLLGDRPGGLVHGPLQPVRGDHVLHRAAPGTGQVVVVPGEVLGQLVAPVVVDTGDPAHDTRLDQHRHVPVGARLREGLVGLQDLGDRQRAPGGGQRRHQRPAYRGVALLEAAEP